MRTLLKRTAVMLVGIATAGSLFAGDQLFDFNDGTLPTDFLLIGSQAGAAYQLQDGNPAGGGYLQLTTATAGQTAGIVFPDVDLYTNSLGTVVSLPVKAIRFEMDLRVGNGTRRPADGFSISFCRPTDPAYYWARQNQFRGFAGGDGCPQATQPASDVNACTSGTAENGTKTGLAILFDTWQGNELPNTAASTTCADNNDVEGIAVRLDDKTLIQVPMANRNGGCYVTELNPGDACMPIAQSATDSMQTGPWTGLSTATGDGGVSDLGYANLSWQRFTAEINEAKQVTVTWKGATILDRYPLANYPTSQGRLFLAARCGGNFEHTHIDNVRVITVPAVQPVLDPNGAVTVRTNGFTINVLNIANAVATNFPFVSMDGVNITGGIVQSNYLDVYTYGTFTMTTNFTARSTHNLVIAFKDTLGNTYTNNASFIVPQFLDLDPSIAIDLALIDTAQAGFKIKTYQGYRFDPTQLRWNEEKVIGIRGPNNADQTGAVGGFFNWAGVPHFSNGGGGGFFPGTVTPWTAFGIGNAPFTSADHSAIEMFGYLYFPSAGAYAMNLGSDDGYRLSFAANPMDRMGAVASEFDGGRGLGEPGDPFTLVVAKPGCYPFRLLWENGGGGADLQWMSVVGTNYTLINDVTNTAAVLSYAVALPAAPLGAYVKRANPVRDAQNVTFYQPVMVELGNGNGDRTVKQNTIALAVDGVNQTLTFSNPDASTTRLLSQMGASVWSVGRHTNVLTFADNAGTNYNYSWTFTVINVQPTNTIPIPVANMVPSSAVDSTQLGFRVKSWQSPHDNPNNPSWTEMQLQGLKGPNVAYQNLTNGPGFFFHGNFNAAEGDGMLDLRYSSGGGAQGEWGYSKLYTDLFGIGQNGGFTWTGVEAYRFNFAANKAESSALDIGTWLVFPSAGYYIIHVNTDDNCKMLVPTGHPFGKLGIVLTESSGGRGVAGASGAQVGGDYCAISIPAPGAYPFRLVYENGGTDGGIEWSIYKTLPDGGVAKLPINDLSDPNSIKAYQALTAGDTVAPYVSYANPPYNHRDTVYWQPVVVELADGPGTKAVNPSTIQLIVNGSTVVKAVTQPNAGVTRIVQDMAGSSWLPSSTNIVTLTFADNAGTTYSYVWPFRVMNFSPYVNNQPGVVTYVPASSAVPISSVDHNKPGFRVYPHQTAGTDPGNVQQAEEQLLGLRGANIADLTLTNGPGFFTNIDVIDFSDGYNHVPGTTGYDVDSARGEFRYNYAFSRFGFQPKGGTVNTNGTVLLFAGYMEFPKAGLYAMCVNSDDGFKLMVPTGNPLGQAGSILGWFNAGRGISTGTGFDPRGTVFVFDIPAPGAYPMRLLWWNGGGGLDLEWSVWQFMPDGSVARTIVGDTNTVGAIQVYQESSQSAPYVVSMNPGLPYNLAADGLQVMTLGRNQDMTINLRDGNSTVDTSSLAFTIDGIAQPLSFAQPGGGATTVTRYGTNTLPSGFYGPAVFSYRDNAGRTFTYNWTVMSSDYYGTLLGGYPLGVGDPAKPGFLVRTFQAWQPGGVALPTRIYVAEELLAGIWTNANSANLTTATDGYFVRQGSGPTDGVINFNFYPAEAGDFTAANGHAERPIPGIPGLSTSYQSNSITSEVVAYVEFPTNGTYVLGVNSDDGFRVTRGWAPANNKGAMMVHSPASIAGTKVATLPSMASRLLTNAISGQIVQALGVGNGSSNPIEACAISNGAELAGKIALVYRGTCGFVAKVQNAAAAGAIAVVIVQDRPVTTPADGWFPIEMGITPIQSIPAIMIKRSDGDAIVAALSNNTAMVHVSLTPMDYLVNPPANSPVLGQADVGRGASAGGGTLFNVTVPTAGVYPLRLVWFQGGGGANCEWFSLVGGTRALLNDSTVPGSLKAYYGLTVPPSVSLQVDGGNATIDYTGTLQTATEVTGPWTDVYGQPPLIMPVSQVGSRFFRSR